MIDTSTLLGTCPRCGGPMTKDRYSTSRRDGRTRICPPCGTSEAFVDFFRAIARPLPPEWQEREDAFAKTITRVKEGTDGR